MQGPKSSVIGTENNFIYNSTSSFNNLRLLTPEPLGGGYNNFNSN